MDQDCGNCDRRDVNSAAARHLQMTAVRSQRQRKHDRQQTCENIIAPIPDRL